MVTCQPDNVILAGNFHAESYSFRFVFLQSWKFHLRNLWTVDCGLFAGICNFAVHLKNQHEQNL
jgi:hypothetical protein